MVIRNKRGWIRILEATIAVLLVSGVLVVTYSNQPVHSQDLDDYVYNLQQRVLRDISLRSDLRNFVLIGDEASLDELDNYVQGMIPTTYSYYIRVCDLGDACNGIDDVDIYKESIAAGNVFTQSTIISSDLGGGTNALYEPKKVLLVIWENR